MPGGGMPGLNPGGGMPGRKPGGMPGGGMPGGPNEVKRRKEIQCDVKQLRTTTLGTPNADMMRLMFEITSESSIPIRK